MQFLVRKIQKLRFSERASLRVSDGKTSTW